MAQQFPQLGLFTLGVNGRYQPATLDAILAIARERLDAELARGPVFDRPGVVRDYLVVKLGREEREVFAVVFLDAQHRVIEYRDMFFGTVSQTSVYPREIVKAALALNAGAVILAHNHPSGAPEPSRADEMLTQTLKSTLAVVDVRVLDHIVVGGGQTVSFAERGLL